MQQLDVDFFLGLETRGWDALVAGDANADDRLLSDEFLGVYSTGFAGKSEHVGQLAAGPSATSYSLSHARLCVLGEDIVLLAYLARWSRPTSASGGTQESMYISSIWKRSNGDWRNLFSQDTKAEG